MGNDMASESWFTERTVFMKDSGKKTIDLVKGWNDTQMETNMKVTSKEVKLMEKVFIIGLMERCMTVSGRMA